MRKNIAFAVGLFLTTVPLLAGAQSITTTIVQPSPYAALVSLYTELIQLLQQEIAVLENVPSQQTSSFSASPAFGVAPLSVSFTTEQFSPDSTYSVDFGDGQNGTMTKDSCIAITAIVGGQGGIRCSYSVSHSYVSADTYNATLTGGVCSCPAHGICNCPNIMILGTATITVSAPSTASNIQQMNAPGIVALSSGGIAEIRNESFYFTLESLTSSTATIQVTPVGCWNSFPSDTSPAIRCMIATVLIPPQTLSIGQSYDSANYGIMLSEISNNMATFSVSAPSTLQ